MCNVSIVHAACVPVHAALWCDGREEKRCRLCFRCWCMVAVCTESACERQQRSGGSVMLQLILPAVTTRTHRPSLEPGPVAQLASP